jgi:hypothetical protein
MDTVNDWLTRASDWLLGWSAGFSPLTTLLVWSAVAGVVMALVFLYTSNQRAIKASADRSRAQVLAIDLFGHDPRAIFGSLGQLLRYSGLRLWHSLPPMLVMLVPFALVLSQLALRYEYRPLPRGASTIVKLELTDQGWPEHQGVALEAPPHVVVETPALRDSLEHAVYWRVRPTQAEPVVLRWQLGEQAVDKRVDVDLGDDRLATVSPRRPGRNWWDRLLHPAEPALPADSPARGIQVDLPRRETPVLGLDAPWWLTFVLTSIVAALVLRPIVKVRF